SSANDFSWKGHVNSGQVVEIKGVRGNIRAEPTTGTEVEVLATKAGPNGSANKIDIKVVQHQGGVTICALYPTIDANQPHVCSPGTANDHEFENFGLVFFRNNDVRVDFTVRVPAGVRFVGRTLKGQVEAASLKSDIEAFTVNGNVRVSTDGHVMARSMTGSIDASLAATNWTRPVDLQTVNGDIIVALPNSANMSVRGETNRGRITSDFPLTVEKKRVNGVIGTGAGTLRLKTETGSIKLQRTP
ncbi:MAG TPA: DUF4097 family beta strand repeat-containing protein, partial [Pyrinomonadaceae bacterium]|nr:DUF4097 family beta strand repeat-containing protein [Pyrinomonadaceae bacterium]